MKAKAKFWSKKKIASQNAKDIALIKTADPRVAALTDEQIKRLWSWFSDLWCAGWVVPIEERLPHFIEWAFASPYEKVRLSE